MIKTIKFILNLLKYKKLDYLFLFFLFILLNFSGLVKPLIFITVIDKILPEKDIKKLIFLLFILIILEIIVNLISLASNYYYNYLSQKLKYDFKYKFINHILKLPLSFFDNTSSGEILNRIRDTDSILDIIDNLIFNFSLNLISFLIFFAFSLYINPTLSLISLIGVPLFFYFNLYMGEIKKRKSQELWIKNKNL